MADEADHWARAVESFTGYKMPSRGGMFDDLTGLGPNGNAPLISVSIEDREFMEMTESTYQAVSGPNMDGHDFVIHFFLPGKENPNDVNIDDYSEEDLKEKIYPKLRKVLINFVGPNGADINLSFDNPFSWTDGGSSLQGMKHPLGQYIEGAGNVLNSLGYDGSNSTAGFSSNGATVDVSRAMDFESFTRVAETYDKVAKFFTDHTETLKQWNESLGADNAAWKGMAAEVFAGLVDGLHTNYGGFADQMHPGDFSAANTSMWDSYASTSRQGDALLGAGNAVFTAVRDLYKAWKDWDSGTSVGWTGLEGSEDLEYLPGLGSPYGILYSMLESAQTWAYNHNARFAVAGSKEGGTVSTFTTNQGGTGGTWTSSQAPTKEFYVLRPEAEQAIPGLGNLNDVATWAGFGKKAVESWNQGVEDHLAPAANTALSNVNNAFIDARHVMDEVLEPKVSSYFGGTDGTTGLDGEDGDDSALDQANAEAQAAIDQANAEAQAAIEQANNEAQSAADQAQAEADQANSGAESAIDQANAQAQQAIDQANAQADQANPDAQAALDQANAQSDQSLSDPGSQSASDPGSQSTGDPGTQSLGADSQSSGDPGSQSNAPFASTGTGGSLGQGGSGSASDARKRDGASSQGAGGGGATSTATPDGSSQLTDPGGGTSTDPGSAADIPDPGSEIVTQSGGPADISDPGSEITTGQDGPATSSDGTSTVTGPDGSTTMTSPDGSTVTTDPDGTSTLTSPDGSSTITSPDGTVQVTDPGGGTTTTFPDGTTNVTDPDGTSTVTAPDGSTTVTGPDGTVQATDSGGGSSSTVSHDGSLSLDDPNGAGIGGSGGGSAGIDAPDLPSSGSDATYPTLPADSGSLGQGDGSSFGDGGPSSDGYDAYDDGAAASQGTDTGFGSDTSGNPFVAGDHGGADAGALGAASNSGSGSPMMPPMGGMRGGGGGGGEAATERERSSPGPRVSRAAMRRGPSSTQGTRRAATPDEELEEDVMTTRSSAPFVPGMPPPAQPGRTTTQSGDRERTAWVAEDEDVWGTDEGTTPAVIGR